MIDCHVLFVKLDIKLSFSQSELTTYLCAPVSTFYLLFFHTFVFSGSVVNYSILLAVLYSKDMCVTYKYTQIECELIH